MEIIHVGYDARPYGIRTFLVSLIKYQSHNYKDIKVAVAFHADHKDIHLFEKVASSVYCLNRKSAKDIRLIFNFYKIFKNYDIVNLHTSSPWAFLAALMAKKKIILTFHGALGFKQRWTDVLYRLFYKAIINKYCSKITFASQSSLNRYIVGTGTNPLDSKIELFPYGAQLSAVKPRKSREIIRSELNLDQKFAIGTAARMDRMKRLDRLIEAFAKISARKDFELFIIGTGDKHYQKYLRDLVKDLQLEDKVHFLGYREDIYDLMNAFDLFVLPSRNEPFGIALLEAMVLGVPSVVFSDGGGTVDILGESGFIVKSTQELRDIILKLKDNNLLRENVSHKVKERAWQFDIRNTAEDFHRVYSELYGS